MQAKADVRQEEKFDYAKLHDEITELEKRVRGETKYYTQNGALPFDAFYVR